MEFCEIKKEGAVKLGEALKVNKTLNSLGNFFRRSVGKSTGE
jgi:hypothetical protein